jgi:D,D-heptose 1,7-bisphosphate phosphatase
MARTPIDKNSRSPFIKQLYNTVDAASRKTVFLDRDGTINKNINYITNIQQLHFLPGVLDGIKIFNKHNVVVIVITNQPVIARGLATPKDIARLHDAMIDKLANKGAYIDAIYFCPHHPEKHHPDISRYALQYRIECECRKPKLAMLKEAVKDFNINLSSAYFIGDSSTDIKAGEGLGIKTLLLKTGFKGEDKKYLVEPDYISDNFRDAVDRVINY